VRHPLAAQRDQEEYVFRHRLVPDPCVDVEITPAIV